MALNNNHSVTVLLFSNNSTPAITTIFNCVTTNKSKEEFEDTNGVIRISINRRRTDNAMTKRKRTNNDLQSIHIKLKIEQHELN
jgi:hypothetical protein